MIAIKKLKAVLLHSFISNTHHLDLTVYHGSNIKPNPQHLDPMKMQNWEISLIAYLFLTSCNVRYAWVSLKRQLSHNAAAQATAMNVFDPICWITTSNVKIVNKSYQVAQTDSFKMWMFDNESTITFENLREINLLMQDRNEVWMRLMWQIRLWKQTVVTQRYHERSKDVERGTC